MPPKFILPLEEIPQTALIDADGLGQFNPQRFEMRQLNAITLLDPQRQVVVGYKDVTADEFWVRGHMPGYPILPGVLMCEAAAQLCAFYCRYVGLMKGDFIGFGGMDNVRFRGPVYPGQRLWIVGQALKQYTRRMTFLIQGFVENSMVFNGEFIGVPMSEKGTAEGE